MRLQLRGAGPKKHIKPRYDISRLQDTRTKSTFALQLKNGKAKEGPPEAHVAADGREGNEADGKDLEQHSSCDKGPAGVEGLRCCPARHPM